MPQVQPRIYNTSTQQDSAVLRLLGTGVEIMRIIKTVSLDEKSAQLANQMPNFSHFVRECLFRYSSNFQAQECARDGLEEFDGKCNPFVAPTCFVCWPDGCPPKKSIRQFRQDNLSVSWLLEQAKFANREMPDLTNVNHIKQELPKSPSKVGILASIKAKIDRFL
tara:strand:+ start:307 stop:801 length:495 start_codon:yes stop_codon:yes gene_type:complete